MRSDCFLGLFKIIQSIIPAKSGSIFHTKFIEYFADAHDIFQNVGIGIENTIALDFPVSLLQFQSLGIFCVRVCSVCKSGEIYKWSQSTKKLARAIVTLLSHINWECIAADVVTAAPFFIV